MHTGPGGCRGRRSPSLFPHVHVWRTANTAPGPITARCETYVRTLNGDGLVDETFSSIVTGCASTDRETVGSRLSGLLKYIDYMMGRPSEME